MTRNVALILIALTGAGLSACERTPPDREVAPATTVANDGAGALDPAVRSQLDSGNAAFAADRHETARAHYRKVTELQPDLSAGWFGVYMAESKLGNQAAADSAIARARKEGTQ